MEGSTVKICENKDYQKPNHKEAVNAKIGKMTHDTWSQVTYGTVLKYLKESLKAYPANSRFSRAGPGFKERNS